MKFLVALALTLAGVPAFADTPDTPVYLRAGPNRDSEQYYKDESLRAGEEGRCIVRSTITVAGTSIDESIEKSTGFANLDWSCLKWIHYLLWVPATHNGQPVQKTISVPITWRIKPQLHYWDPRPTGVGEIK